MSKIIIENNSSCDDAEVAARVIQVIEMGRVSGNGDKKQYCYHTRFPCTYGFIGVSAFLNKSSDRFVVTDKK